MQGNQWGYSFDESVEKNCFVFKGGISIFIRVREKIEWRYKGPNAEETDMICGVSF